MPRKLHIMARMLCVAWLLWAGSPARAQIPSVPDDPGVVILIRTTLVALNHANRTGNYTVLRDLGAPSFASANSAARLGQIFARLRRRNLDLGPVTVVAPKLHRQPFIDEQGMLRLAGHVPSRPVQVNFNLVFQHAGGHWRLFGISVNPTTASTDATKEPVPEKAR